MFDIGTTIIHVPRTCRIAPCCVHSNLLRRTLPPRVARYPCAFGGRRSSPRDRFKEAIAERLLLGSIGLGSRHRDRADGPSLGVGSEPEAQEGMGFIAILHRLCWRRLFFSLPRAESNHSMLIRSCNAYMQYDGFKVEGNRAQER